ncbi:MAG TPA: hypothetical protein VGY98_08230 [Verrucomicrobiae bacterium]|nr:hypothetical protein [Verrucomicrobiae bacterium]
MKPLITASILAVWLMLGFQAAQASDSAPSVPVPQAHHIKAAKAPVLTSSLPLDLKRVVMLPPACGSFTGPMFDGCQTLGPVLQAELIKTARFEVVAADPETLRNCTGDPGWTGEEVLPLNFLDSLREYYGCDAILFCHVTTFRSSPPLAVGWRLKLVDAKTGTILWAADQIFDAKDRAVAKAAEQYERQRQPRQSMAFHVYSFLAWCINTPTRTALDDQWNIFHSPRYFGEFSAAELLKTLPER